MCALEQTENLFFQTKQNKKEGNNLEKKKLKKNRNSKTIQSRKKNPTHNQTQAENELKIL